MNLRSLNGPSWGMAVILLVTGCTDGTTDPAGSPDLQLIGSDRNAYVAEPTEFAGGVQSHAFMVVAEFTNDTDRTIYLQRCLADSPAPLFRVAVVDAGGDTRAAYDELPSCVEHSEHFVVEPGESRVDELGVWGPHELSGIPPQPVGIFEGSFRLMYWDRGCQGPNNCEPGTSPADLPTAIYSNEFDVTLAAPSNPVALDPEELGQGSAVVVVGSTVSAF